jgi:hypothetical protein
MLHSIIAHSIICTWLFRGKMHSDWLNEIEILQGRLQHGEKVGCCYHSGLEKTHYKWELYVPLVTKGLGLGNSKSSKVSNLRRQSAWSVDGTQKQTQK